MEILKPVERLSARQFHIANSPKKSGNCDYDSKKYLQELQIEILPNKQPIQFTSNINERVHGWAPYVQGFSASFVQSVLDQYKKDYDNNPIVLDPFSGCGTVLVQTKLNGFQSCGTELNPLLHFIANTKLNTWNVNPFELLNTYNNLSKNKIKKAPGFLRSVNQFNPEVLNNLEIINGALEELNEGQIKNLLNLAFSAILIDCSNLKRSPCLGYAPNKKVEATAPFVLMTHKVNTIADDLESMQNELFNEYLQTKSEVILANAMEFKHGHKYDLVITSPPYMNGLDYVINYKIEMGWLNFAQNQNELKKVKDEMVVCDNVSKGLIKHHEKQYTNSWIEELKSNIHKNSDRRGSYRRLDMPEIVHKYFDDMYKVMKNVAMSMKPGARFVQVVGDSLIADVYVPTDLLLAKIGMDLGLNIEKIEKARDRRSGQIRSYKLRETIITLRK